FERQAATVAEWRLDKPHLLPAAHTNETFRRACPLRPANLAYIGIDESQSRVHPIFQPGSAHRCAFSSLRSGRRVKTNKVRRSTGNATHPFTMAIRPLPHHQSF